MMRRFRNNSIGIDQGDIVLFSDFEDDGPMWSGRGPRLIRTPVSFQEAFFAPPVVQVALSMWDISNTATSRADVQAEDITNNGFAIVFRTWADTKIARVRVSWIAIGELYEPDDWRIE
jgi:hypothetical protein